MSQSRRSSLMESFLNVLVGYFVAVGSQVVLFPCFDIHVPLLTNVIIGFYFTVISIIRSYVIRRLFNRRAKCPIQ